MDPPSEKESPEDSSLGIDSDVDLDDELVEIINGEESPLMIKKRAESTEEERSLRKRKQEEDYLLLKKEFEELWFKSYGQSELKNSDGAVIQKGLPRLIQTHSFHSKIAPLDKRAAALKILTTRGFRSTGTISALRESDSPSKNKVIRRCRSLDFAHSWDLLGYFPEKDWRRNLKRRNKKNHNVRFAADTKDNSKPELNLQTLEEILLKEQNDDKEGLMMEPVTLANGQKKDLIIAGTVEKLVSQLIDSTLPDQDYVREFLYSFRSIVGPMNLLTVLIDRYSYIPPPSAKKDEQDRLQRTIKVMRLRVVNVIRKWLTNHFYDFVDESRLLTKLVKFIDEHEAELDIWALQLRLLIQDKHVQPFVVARDSPRALIEVTMKRGDCGMMMRQFIFKKQYYNCCFYGHEFAKWATEEVRNCSYEEALVLGAEMMRDRLIFPIQKKITTFEASRIYRCTNKEQDKAPKPMAPPNIVNANGLVAVKFLDIHPKEMARQLSILSYNMYRSVTSKELTKLEKANWTPMTDTSLETIARHGDNIASWIASEIVMTANDSQRAETLKRFVQIAKYLLKYQNFSSADAIVRGLNHPGVQRLAKTWKIAGRKPTRSLQKTELALKPENIASNMKKFQENPPVLPILGTYIPVIVEKFQAPRVLVNGMIDFKRLRGISQIFETIESCIFTKPYPFTPVQAYQTFLSQEVVILDEKTIMKYSFQCEKDRSDSVVV